IKPLEFDDNGDTICQIGAYMIYELSPGQWNAVVYPSNGERKRVAEKVQKQDAITAAQADYESRILAAIDLTAIDGALAQARREGRGEGMLEERRRWWRPEYPEQVEPTRVVWYRDEPEDGLSGFDTKADRDAFQAG